LAEAKSHLKPSDKKSDKRGSEIRLQIPEIYEKRLVDGSMPPQDFLTLVWFTAASTDARSRSPAYCANALTILQKLLAFGIAVNTKKGGHGPSGPGAREDSVGDPDFNNTALIEAVCFPEAIRFLLSVEGIDVNAQNGFGETALITAAAGGQYETIKLLMAVEAIKADVTNKDGKTALDVLNGIRVSRAETPKHSEIAQALKNVLGDAKAPDL
jgi:hypothetical protein